MAIRAATSSDGAYRTATVPDYSGAYTLCFWVRLVGGLGGAALYDSGYGSFEGMFVNAGDVRLQHEGNMVVCGSAAADTWYHFAIVRSASNSVKGFVDGVEGNESTTDVAGRATADRLDFGGSGFVGGGGDYAYARLWTVALTPEELALEMASATAVKTASLWADWPLEVHTDLEDASGNVRHLSASGTLTTTDGPELEAPPASGGGTLTPTTWANKWALESLTM